MRLNRRAFGLVLAAAMLFPLATAAESEKPAARKQGHSFAGHLLVATQKMRDPRFARSVIYMVEHSREGAMGLVINRVIGRGSTAKFLHGFGIEAEVELGAILLHYGGPVERGRGLVLHTGDYSDRATKVVDERFSMTTELEVLRAMARGEGPRRTLFALGYAGWAPGQLEDEMSRDDWVLAPADEDLVFDDDMASKWERAMAKVRVRL